MGRLRARLAKSEIDREVQGHLVSAQRQVRAALEVCSRAKKAGGIEAHRSRRIKRDLLRALGSLEAVSRLTPIREETAEVPTTKVGRAAAPPPKPTLPETHPKARHGNASVEEP
jgi:hypothetical protein